MIVSSDTRNKELKSIFFLVILFIQIIEYPLFLYFPFLKPLDELIAVISIIYLLLLFLSAKAVFLSNEKLVLVCYGIICFIGLLANFIFEYQPVITAFTDMLVFSKFIFGYFLSRMLLADINMQPLTKAIDIFSRIISIVLFGALILNLVTNIFPTEDIRYSLPSQQLFFGYPTYLGATCVVVMSLLTINLKNQRSNLIYIGMCIIVALSTGRMKVIAFIPIYLILSYYTIKGKGASKILISFTILCGLLLSYQQFNYYYMSNDDFARKVLTLTSFKIADNHFPLGSGFATFSSNESGVHYSPIYKKYGISNTQGITYRSHLFISDTFWPMILGQFGYLGLLFFFLLILSFFLVINKLRIFGFNYFYSSLTVFIYLLITSTAESSFVQPYAVLYFYIIGMYSSQLIYKEQHSTLRTVL